MWPFLYFAGDRLSGAELTAARLDGDLFEVGEAYMPADAVETRDLRAASLRRVVGDTRAATHASAAWVHGALSEPPLVHSVQRASDRRARLPIDVRVHVRDLVVPPTDLESIGGVLVTTPVRTVVDIARIGDDTVLDALLTWRPELLDAALRWLAASGPVHHKRAALSALRARQDVVTR
jgi:hypothetical protein